MTSFVLVTISWVGVYLMTMPLQLQHPHLLGILNDLHFDPSPHLWINRLIIFFRPLSMMSSRVPANAVI